jgi:hypothetical protein
MEKKFKLIIFGFLVLSLVPNFVIPAFAQETLYQVNSPSSDDPNLYVIDGNDGSTISSVEVTLAGETVRGFRGLTASSTGELWALLAIQGQDEALLVTIDPSTGTATLIGDTGDKFTNLAFDASGTLYTVSSPNTPINVPPHNLFTLDTSNGLPTQVCDLPFNSSFGTSLGFSPAVPNSLFYTEGDSPAFFHELTNITVDPCAFTNIPLTDDGIGDFNALAWSNENNAFFLGLGVGGDQLYLLPVDGDNSFIGELEFSIVTGLAVVRDTVVGGISIPIDQSALLLAGMQSVSMWMIPVVVAGIGIGIFVIKRRN